MAAGPVARRRHAPLVDSAREKMRLMNGRVGQLSSGMSIGIMEIWRPGGSHRQREKQPSAVC